MRATRGGIALVAIGATAPLAGPAGPATAADPECRTARFGDPSAGLVAWTAPPGTQEVRATLAGGRGADAVSGSYPDVPTPAWTAEPATGGGQGAVVTGTLDVRAGQTVTVVVGGGADGPDGGANGGGEAAPGPFLVSGEPVDSELALRPGGGGGASDIRVGGTRPGDRVLVAAGGGGAGAMSWSNTELGVPTPPPPDLVGDGGDAGSDGQASFGWVDYAGTVPFAGVAVEGRTQVNRPPVPAQAVEGTLTAGTAGQPSVGGTAGTPTVPAGAEDRYPQMPGQPGALGRGGDGGRLPADDPSAPGHQLATGGGGGGGGLYGGGGGGGMGVLGSSTPVPGLVSGGGGGSSLGTITGLHDQIDGYVEITTCVQTQVNTNGPTGAAPGVGGTDAAQPAGGSSPGVDQLPATGPGPLGGLGLIGAGLIGLGLIGAGLIGTRIAAVLTGRCQRAVR
ncbi:MAG: hypothetical protein ACRC35_11890 [Angustibacter sp.]